MVDPPQADARELFEFAVSFASDTNELDADTLAEVSANREPIRRLMAAARARPDATDCQRGQSGRAQDEAVH